MPAAIQKDIDAYLESIRTQVTYLDCLWDELYGSINANQWGWEISKEQADYLRQKYLFGPEDEEESEDLIFHRFHKSAKIFPDQWLLHSYGYKSVPLLLPLPCIV